MNLHHGSAALAAAAPPIMLEPWHALAQLPHRADVLGIRMATLRRLIARSFVLVDADDDDRQPSGHGTILVALDHPVLRSIALEVLEGLGYRVELVDGRSIGLPTGGAVDVILLDVPWVNEERLAEIRRATALSQRIVVATSLPEGPGRQRLREVGVVGFVAKPFDPRELARCLQDVLLPVQSTRT